MSSISKENISGLKARSDIKDSMAGSSKEGSNNLELFAEYSEQQKQNATRQKKLNEIYPSSIANIREQSSGQNISSEKESNEKNNGNIAINLVSNFDAVEVGKNEMKNDKNSVKNSVIEHPIEEQKNEIENIIKEVEAVPQEKSNDADKNNEIPVKNESKNIEPNNISQKQLSQTKKDAKTKNNIKNNLRTKEKTKEINKNNKKKESKKNIVKQRSNKINATSKDKATQMREIIKNFKTTNHLKSRIIKDDQKQLQQYAGTVLKERDRLIKKLQEQKNKLLQEQKNKLNEMRSKHGNKVFSADNRRAKIRKNITQLEQLDQEMEKLKLDAKDGKYNYTFFPNTIKLHQLEKKRTAKVKVSAKKTVKKDSDLNKKKTGQVKITTTKIKKEPKPLMEKTLSNLNKIEKEDDISKEQTDKKIPKNFNKGTLPENKAKKQENIELTDINTRRQFDKSVNMNWFALARKQSMIQREKDTIGAIKEKLKKTELNKKDHSMQRDEFLLNIKNKLKHVPNKEQQEQMKKSLVNNNEIIEEKKEEKKENNNVQVQKPQEKVDKKNNNTTVIKKNITKFSNKTKKQKIKQYNNMSASNNINAQPKTNLKLKNKQKVRGK